MKIVFTFFDMVRGDLTSLVNNKIQDSLFESIIKKSGGTYYSNAHTIAPDTARAWGSILSGCYPIKNGCNQPGYYPELFYKLNYDLFSFLIEYNYNIYALITPREYERGFFPKNIKKNIKIYFEPNEVVNAYNDDNSNNKLLFFYSEDYHRTILENPTLKNERKARDLIGKNLKFLYENLDIDNIDKFLLLSDHGCTLDIDKHNNSYSIDNNKTNVVLYIKDKEDKNLSINNMLVSLLDIFPTIVSWISEDSNFNFDGFSLNDTMERKLIIEDGFANYQGFLFNREELFKYYILGLKTVNGFDKYKLNDLNKDNIPREIFLYSTFAKKFFYDLLVYNKECLLRQDKMNLELMNNYDKDVVTYNKNGKKLKYLHGDFVENNYSRFSFVFILIDILIRISKINKKKIIKALKILLSKQG